MFGIPVWLQAALVLFGLVLIVNLLSCLCKPGKVTVSKVSYLGADGYYRVIEKRTLPCGKTTTTLSSTRNLREW
jgi:hypothetical protein